MSMREQSDGDGESAIGEGIEAIQRQVPGEVRP